MYMYMTWVGCSLGYKNMCTCTCNYVHPPPWIMTSTYIEVEWYRVTLNLLQFVGRLFLGGHSHTAVCANVTKLDIPTRCWWKKKARRKATRYHVRQLPFRLQTRNALFRSNPHLIRQTILVPNFLDYALKRSHCARMHTFAIASRTNYSDIYPFCVCMW